MRGQQQIKVRDNNHNQREQQLVMYGTSSMYTTYKDNLPAQHTQDQVQHEEAPHHNQRDEKDPVVGAANGVVGLNTTLHLLHMLKDTAAASTYRIQNRRPALHRHALEHCQHGQADVVEGGDAVVGPPPLFQAD